MKRFVALLLMSVCGITALSGADSKPALLLGQNYDSNQVGKNILQPTGIQYTVSQQWVKPQEYSKYAVVYYGTTNKSQKEAKWESAEDIAALKQYVSDGGILILTGDSVYDLSGEKRSLKKLQEIIGFGSSWGVKSKKYHSLSFTTEGEALREKAGLGKEPLNLFVNCIPSNISTGKVLAQYTGTDVKPESAILLNTLGKGKVYFVPINYFSFCRAIKTAGEKDSQGNVILNEDGKRAQSLARIYTAIFLSAENLSHK